MLFNKCNIVVKNGQEKRLESKLERVMLTLVIGGFVIHIHLKYT